MMNVSTLPAEFYNRSTVLIARELLGRIIVSRKHGIIRKCRIVEDEAYLVGDPACHSHRGITKRNASMFKEPGTLYVFTMHRQNCMNVVTMKGEAILLRAAEPMNNIDKPTNGPGKLSLALGVTRAEDDGKSLISSDITIEDDGWKPKDIGCSPRIGLTKAKDRFLRFYVKGNRYVSSRTFKA